MSLSDILESLPGNNTGRLCELGKIKIGGLSKRALISQKTKKEWRPPEKYDHFVITTMLREKSGDLIVDKKLMDELIAEHGDEDGKLRTIPIRLVSDDIEDILQSAFVWYRGKTPGARGDGKTVTWFANPQDNLPYSPPIEEKWGPELLTMKLPNGANVFKVHTNMSCVIASKHSRWGGVYKFRTTSLISLTQLHASLLHLSSLTGGILMSMPLMLVLRPVQVNPDGKPSTVYVVHVELRGEDLQQLQKQAVDMANFKLAHITQVQSAQRQYRKLLEGPGNEPPEEVEGITAEFSPEEETTDIVTVPPDAKFGMLDDEPGTTAIQSENDPPIGSPRQWQPAQYQQPVQTAAPATQTNDPEPENVDLDHQQEEPPAQDAEYEAQEKAHVNAEFRRIAIAEVCDQSWPHFLAGWAKLSGKTVEEITRVAGRIALRLSRKGKEETISPETRRQWIEHGDNGRLDWASGAIAHDLRPGPRVHGQAVAAEK